MKDYQNESDWFCLLFQRRDDNDVWTELTAKIFFKESFFFIMADDNGHATKALTKSPNKG